MDDGSGEHPSFGELVGEVLALKGEAVVDLKRAPEITPGLLERRRAAQALAARDENFLPTGHIPPVDPHAELSFLRPGVQHGVFRRLRLGEYRCDSRLDLHGLSVTQAREALWRFVADCMRHDVRVALVTHGRGAERNTPALLKSCVALWLPRMAEVLAFHSAPRHLGGTGATLVLLRKSERARLENFERHNKRAR
ncbi:MAG: putative DNA endonuclease SmrA [Pseudomonadales bacterium]|nr:putative DNA endonuclease SmrA [Pseudomonadales bacterium]